MQLLVFESVDGVGWWGVFANRRLALQKERRTQASRKLHCCSRLKYYIIIVSHVHPQKQLLSGFYDLIGSDLNTFSDFWCS